MDSCSFSWDGHLNQGLAINVASWRDGCWEPFLVQKKHPQNRWKFKANHDGSLDHPKCDPKLEIYRENHQINPNSPPSRVYSLLANWWQTSCQTQPVEIRQLHSKVYYDIFQTYKEAAHWRSNSRCGWCFRPKNWRTQQCKRTRMRNIRAAVPTFSYIFFEIKCERGPLPNLLYLTPSREVQMRGRRELGMPCPAAFLVSTRFLSVCQALTQL